MPLKLFALRDESNGDQRDLAILEYYEQSRSFYFELPPDADPWGLPFILHEFAKRGQHTVDAAWTARWVEARIVPPERQNLGEILRVNGLKEYDELRLLELTEGRCSQDWCYLVPMRDDCTPDWYRKRVERRARDVYGLSHFRLAVVQRDGTAIICDVSELVRTAREFARISSDEQAFMRVSMQPGGHGARWGEGLQLSIEYLCGIGTLASFDGDDIALLASQAVCDTSEVAQLLDCTRQNVSDLVRRGKLVPLRSTTRGMLFLRADVLARR